MNLRKYRCWLHSRRVLRFAPAGSGVQLHDWMTMSHLRTPDPEEADFFFVPGYAICIFEGGFLPYSGVDAVYRELIPSLPYFHRHEGRDHVFTFTSGLSVNVFKSWRDYIPNSIFLTPETSVFNDVRQGSTPFDTWKDIAVPGFLMLEEGISLVRMAQPLSNRPLLSVFFGRIDPSRGKHPTRPHEVDIRVEIAKLESEDLFIGQNLSMVEVHQKMGQTKFCLIPKGKSAWSLRLYEALFANCVPVVLSDYWELPFENFINFSSFIIKWPTSGIGKLLSYLREVPDKVIERYMEVARDQRCWFMYPPPLQEFHDGTQDIHSQICPHPTRNAYEGIVQELVRKRRKSRLVMKDSVGIR
eukprot:GEMP01044320.1.p1 GENE.GEMP01044320.1~~GEMP01044320.1.p1  ORF type:complete len:357 (+),score=33.93 GEMP01044320.1:672-1742(+)